jgi:hypothetical protein
MHHHCILLDLIVSWTSSSSRSALNPDAVIG